ncbi:MAG: hypothetical protein AAGJ80_11130 [Cyanobacteria bacterium J06553_1]
MGTARSSRNDVYSLLSQRPVYRTWRPTASPPDALRYLKSDVTRATQHQVIRQQAYPTERVSSTGERQVGGGDEDDTRGDGAEEKAAAGKGGVLRTIFAGIFRATAASPAELSGTKH